MRRLGGLVLMCVAAASPLLGQRSALREVRSGGSAGLTFVIAQPLGEFERNGAVAVGLTMYGVFPLDRSGALGLRLDGDYMMYDADYRGYGVSTSSSIGTLAVGPQVTFGRGPLRLYGFATVGGSAFWTSVSFDRYCGCYYGDDFILDGHFTTVTQVGSGILINLGGRRRRTPVSIDLGVRDMRHDLVKYVPAGGVTDNGDGSYTVDRVETPVSMRVFQIGVSFGIR
ncbi:MAG TPA: hypothetical protein VGJ83_01155 [Gemmatimonadales bacterium]|jgi:hypothetical protein